MEHATESRSANILLQRGVKVQVAAPLFLRIFGKKTFALTVRVPTVKTSLVIAEKYLRLGIENTGDMALPEAFALLKNYAVEVSRIVALCISPRYHRAVARLLRRGCTTQELNYLFTIVVMYGGIEDFINTIRLIEATRITKPMNLSPEKRAG